MTRPYRLCAALSLLVLCTTGRADTLAIEPAADAALYEVPSGDPETANSRGEHLFAGRILSGERRRALLRFNLASIPAGSVVNSAQLSMSLTRVPPGTLPPISMSLFPVTSGWSEGSSDAGSPGGNGVAATTGDPTWSQRAFPATAWGTAGGDFSTPASAVVAVNGLARYQWGSTAGMVSAVQSWVDVPASNRGWILVADETAGNTTARRFASREMVDAAARPQLLIDYTPGGTGPGPQIVSAIPLLSGAGMLTLLALLALIATAHLRVRSR